MLFYKRPLQSGDANLANEWLEGWGFNPLPIGMYPDTGLVLVYSKEQEVFIAFIWKSNSDMMQIGFVTRNPKYKKLPRDTRFVFMKEVVKTCYDMGAKHLATWTNNPFLKEDFKKIGFTETANNVSEFIIYQLKE
ncbi:hypothetical protein PG299_02565 [Riemerella anatipestifer]|nr:hypothetical protein [Riemerella anatipestifer]